MTKYTKLIRISEDADKVLTDKAHELHISKSFLLDELIKSIIKDFKIRIVIERDNESRGYKDER